MHGQHSCPLMIENRILNHAHVKKKIYKAVQCNQMV